MSVITSHNRKMLIKHTRHEKNLALIISALLMYTPCLLRTIANIYHGHLIYLI